MTASPTPTAKVACLGNAVQDFVFTVEAMPAHAGKHRAQSFSLVGGGPAATAAVAACKLHGAARLITRLGGDAAADLIIAELEGYGVDCTHARRFEGVASSVSAVFVDAVGERMILNHLDAALPSDAGWLPSVAEMGVQAVLADTRWPQGAAHILAQAAAAGVPAILDADAPVRPAEAALRAATHIAFSAQGLQEYAGTQDLEGALQSVAEDTGAWSCVTRGAAGVLIVHGGERIEIPAFHVDVVDTLGAGDVWHGAFALALAEGRDELDAVGFASAAAALKCGRTGGRAGAPSRAEVDEFLAIQADDQKGEARLCS